MRTQLLSTIRPGVLRVFAILLLIFAIQLKYDGSLSIGGEFRLDHAFGGEWHDAEKSRSNRGDDWLCWASTAANVLAWSGWYSKNDFANEDEIFQYYSEHWSDHPSGSPRESWRWWFNGQNHAQKGARVIQNGGAFFPEIPFPEKKWGHPPGTIFRGVGQNQLKRNPYLLRDMLKQGYGVALQIIHPLPDNDRDSHMITLWGYRSSLLNRFSGILITDSDDNKDTNDAGQATNSLVYYPVELEDNIWWFTYKKKRWRILAAYGLMQRSLYSQTE